MRLSIVIPAYNEASTIKTLLERVIAVDLSPVDKEIIVVDDGSTDGTLEIVHKIRQLADAPQIVVLSHKKNKGKGAAVRTGFTHATGDYVVVQDADLEYDPNDLRAMFDVAQQKNAGAVYGSRRLPLPGEVQRRGTWYYYFGGVVLTIITNILYNTHITDEPTCYKMVRNDVLKKISLVADGFEFCPELTAKLAKSGVKIFEVPIHYHPRSTNEGKKIRAKDGLIAIWTLIKYRF